MRVLFIGFLVLNLLLEALGAVLLISGPQGILSELRPEEGMWNVNYGFAAIAIASALFWVWPNRDNRQAVGSVLGILLTFHTALFVSFAIQGNQTTPMIIHAVMAALSIFLYTQISKWCTQ